MNSESKVVPVLFGVVATAVLFVGFYCIDVLVRASVKTVPVTSSDASDSYLVVKHHCEQSGGTFGDAQCRCNTDETYDKNSGLCMTPMGVAGGSSGDVEKQQQELLMVKNTVVQHNCEISGGTFKNTACVCPLEDGEQLEYDSENGYCMTAFGTPGGDEGEVAKKLQACEMLKKQ